MRYVNGWTRWLVIFALCIVFGCDRPQAAEPNEAAKAPAERDAPKKKLVAHPNSQSQPSLVQILAHPEKYHEKEVQVEGFMIVEFEGTAIYLSKEDAEYGMNANGFWVSLPKSPDGDGAAALKTAAAKYNRQYVLLEGTFDMNSRGHMSSWQGAFNNIERIEVLNKRRSAKAADSDGR